MTMTMTYAILEISRAAYIEIAGKLKVAGYDESLLEDGTVLMHGIGLRLKDKEVLGHDNDGPIYLEELDCDALRDGSIRRKLK